MQKEKAPGSADDSRGQTNGGNTLRVARPSAGDSHESKGSLPDAHEEEARALAAVACMIGWSCEVACRLAKPVDSDLHRLLAQAHGRALEVMVTERARWKSLRQQRVRP